MLDGRGYRPDIAGWRRDRASTPPQERPVALRPDLLCEIVSESNRAVDTVTKLRLHVAVLLGDDPEDASTSAG